MRLAAKLVASVVMGIILILAVDTTASVTREVETIESEMEHEARTLGQAFSGLVADVWETSGPERVSELVADANRSSSGITVRWVWFDADAGPDHSPRVPLHDLGPTLDEGAIRSIRHDSPDGNGHIYTYVPVEVAGRREGGLELGQSRDVLDQRIRSTVKRALLFSGAMVVIGASVVVLIGLALVGRPLRMIIEKTRRTGTGDLDGPIHIAGRDEISELAESLNEMCENLAGARHKAEVEMEARIKAMGELRHADRLTTVGRLAAGVAHELGTPLNVVTGRASLIASGRVHDSEIEESASVIKAQGERMAEIIRQLLDFGRRREPKRLAADVRVLVRETSNLVRALCGDEIRIEAEVEEDLVIEVDAAQIQQVLVNLLMNGIQSMPDGGSIRIRATRDRAGSPDAEEIECVRIDVIDQGPGMAAETRERIFEPFFTTKDVGVGTGLGLSVAHGIIEDHEGWIEVDSEPGKGSRFSVFLPMGEHE